MDDHSKQSEMAAAEAALPVRLSHGYPITPDMWNAEAPAVSEGPRHARKITLGLLWRHKWLMLAVFVLLAVPGVLGVWFLVLPQYLAKAVIEVSPVIPRLVFESENSGIIPLYQQYLNTQVAVISSPSVLQRVLEREDVQKTNWYHEHPKPLVGEPPTPLERLLGDLNVEPQRSTQVIDVKFVAQDPHDAVVIVNAVVDEYAKYVAESVRKTDDLVYRELVKEYDSRRSILDTLERDKIARLKQLNTADPGALLSEQRKRLDELTEQHDQLKREVALTEWQVKTFEELEAEAGAKAQDEQSTQAEQLAYERDAEWQRLFADLQRARAAVDAAAQRLGDQHPHMVELRQQQDLAQQLLRDRTALLQRQPSLVTVGDPTKVVDVRTSRDQLNRLRYQEDLLRKDIERRQGELQETANAVERYTRLTDELKQQQALFDTIWKRKTQREVESGAPGAISVQAEAFQPSRAANAKRRYGLLAMALLGAGAAALAAGYVRASTSSAIYAATEVTAFDGPFLGYLPLVRNPQQMTVRERSLRVECVRMVRTALLERIEEDAGCSVLVTSAGPGAGKTDATLLLADSLAQCGKRVLLVDADLRSPSLTMRCNAAGRPGLLNILKGQAGDAEAVVRLEDRGLDLLPAGVGYEAQDSELLAGAGLRANLERWRDTYDIVILDSAPIMAVADARILAGCVDGTVMVVREEHCRRADVTEALGYLNNRNGKLFGMVFVGSVRRNSYYYAYADHSGQSESMSAGSANRNAV